MEDHTQEKSGNSDPETNEISSGAELDSTTPKKSLKQTIASFLATQPELEEVLVQNLPKTLQSEGASTEKRAPGRPRKHPKPDPNAPKRPPGRPRIHPKPAEDQPKRPPGRPRKHPKPDPNAPKRPPGRPRKNPKPLETEPKGTPGRPKTVKEKKAPSSQPKPEPIQDEGLWIFEDAPEREPVPKEGLWNFEREPEEEPTPKTGLWNYEEDPEENIGDERLWDWGLTQEEIESTANPAQVGPTQTPTKTLPKADEETDEEADVVFEDDEKDIRPKKFKEKDEESEKQKDYGSTECLDIYYREIRDHPPLTLEQEQYYSRKYKEEGCLKSREKLVHANLKLVVHIAKRYRGMLRMFPSGISFGDLISEGNIGLLKAIERYKPELGNKVSTYASWWIVQQIQAGIHSKGKMIRIPTHLLQKMRKVQRIIDEYLQLHRKEERLDLESYIPPLLEEMLKSSGFKVEDAISLKSMMNISAPSLSLDEPNGSKGEGGEDGPKLHENIQDENAENPFLCMATSVEADYVTELLLTLSDKERKILIDRFGLEGQEEQTLEQVGTKNKVTRERIRQIQNNALNKLKTRILERQKIDETNQ